MMNWFLSLFKRKKRKIKKVIVTPKLPIVKEDINSLSGVNLSKGEVGVDISHHNRNVDLKVLSKNVDFIYMKATEGITFLSSKYLQRAKELESIDIKWGAYHYYRVKYDPIEQAKFFCSCIVRNSGLPPVLDIGAINNKFKDQHREDLLIFMKQVKKITGLDCIIYTSYYFARDEIKTDSRFKKYPLWIAWYTDSFTRVKVPRPWSVAKIWQYTENGQVNGVDGRVDINRIMY